MLTEYVNMEHMKNANEVFHVFHVNVISLHILLHSKTFYIAKLTWNTGETPIFASDL